MATMANAQDVVLTSIDGNISLRGQLIEFTDQKYTIETPVGTMTLDSDVVECAGEACPIIKPQFSEFIVEGARTLASTLMPDLLSSYAQSLDGQLSLADGPAPTTITVANSDSEAMAKIGLTDSSTSESLNSLLQGQTAIALTSRKVSPEEVSEFENNGIPIESSDHEQIIGLNAIAIVTSKDNPINAISVRDAAMVFSGAYDNWSELGGKDAPINLYGPLAISELTELFIADVIKSQGNDAASLSQEITSIDDVAASVSSDPNGIGYVYFSKSQPAKTLAIQEACGLATPVNSFTIKAEEYPLTQRLYAYSASQKDKPSHINDLLDFLQSNAGQAIAGSLDLVDQRAVNNNVSNQGTRFAYAIATSESDASSALLKDMVTQILNSDRLSTTIRFNTGSNQMDNRSKADLIRLAEHLQSSDNPDTTIRLLGFTDSVGDFELNQELSLRRANLVRTALIDIDASLSDRVSIESAGFGEIAPIACNETALGRSINRRVEVWMSNTDALPTQ